MVTNVHRRRGFTLVELLIVLAIIATLLTIAVPRYFGSLEKSKEAALRQSLQVMREAIDKHMADTGRYPDNLDDLVSKRYLRAIPVDPITESKDSWKTLSRGEGGPPGIFDVRSGAPGEGLDGSPYANW